MGRSRGSGEVRLPGLKTLTVIEEAIRLIRRSGRPLHVAADGHGRRLYDPKPGAENDIGQIPLDDRATYDPLRRRPHRGGVPGRKLGHDGRAPADEAHLHRGYRGACGPLPPGPMENIPTYCEVKNGLRDLESIHPTIDHILKETQGIIVYQEQVMQIAQVMAAIPWRRRPSPPRHGQEEPRGDGPRKAQVHRRRQGHPRDRCRQGGRGFRPSREIRQLRASTNPTPPPMPWSATRRPGSRQPPGRIHGRRHELRHPPHRQARRLQARGRQARDRGGAALRQPQPRHLRRGRRAAGLRPRRAQERGRRRDAADRRGAAGGP